MNKDRIIRLGRRISQSDLWNIGVEGIIEKQVDKLNMSDRLTDTTKLFIRGSLTAAIAGTSWACIKNGINPEVTSSNNQNTTEIAPTEKPFVIPTSTSEVNATMSYEFVEESEIISKLPGPFRAFGEDQRIKDLFEDPSTIEYSASGVKTVDITGKETTYVFFNATSEVEEKSRTAMIFGGDQGEVIYIVLNRIIDAEGRVGLGITQDPATGADLDKSIMIFNTELTEVELSQMTNEEIEARDILFIPGGLLVSPQEIFNVKMASLVKVEVPVRRVEQLDISNPENFRHEEWEYLISPAYLEQLKEKDKRGELPSVGENPSYVKPGHITYKPDKEPTIMIKDNNFDSVFSLSSFSLYQDLAKRPYQLVDITTTRIEGVDFYFYVIKWENDPDKTSESGFLGYIAPISDYIHSIGLDKIVGYVPDRFVTGLYISNTDGQTTKAGCVKVLKNTFDNGTDFDPFCDYLATNQELLLQPDIYREWARTGKLLNANTIPVARSSSIPIK